MAPEDETPQSASNAGESSAASGPFIDVISVGNALVDVLANQPHEFLAERGVEPGSMNLVDEGLATSLYEAIGDSVQISGGSAANTSVGIASLGGSAHFVGRVRNDELGDVFRTEISSTGVGFSNNAATGGSPTGRCIIVITPDAERTMSTYLGASGEFGSEDIDEALIASASITYLEGYLFDSDAAKRAFERAAYAAQTADRLVALTLSDAFCVDRHRESLLSFIDSSVDVLFANEAELLSLYETEDFAQARDKVVGACPVVAVTRSEKGSVIVTKHDQWEVAAEPVDEVVDTTGAGDQFAAGFLFGLTRNKPYDECARIGHVAAAEVISHVGARPLVPLASLI